jgi:pantoate--beta-alanine ligase
VVVSIFVNPRQFGDAGDLAAYPATPERDLALCAHHGASLVVRPSLDEMWPHLAEAVSTTVHVAGPADGFEGAGRPGHFDGVASVVAKLFLITGPSWAYFGEKDYQQLAVVRQMVADLSFPVTVVGIPIVRDDDGLALSSRNVRLSPAGRQRALAMSRVLERLAGGAPLCASQVRAQLDDALVELDVAYAEVVDPLSLRVLGDDDDQDARVLVAARVDGVRLLDNGGVRVRVRKRR